MDPFLTVRQQSGSYPVYVGRDLLDHVGTLVRARGSVFVITSHALRERFGDRVAASFEPRAEVMAIEEGDRGAKRDSLAVVVGGGMLGDTAGFAASVFLRGIDLVHVPTTLLAQVDSSLGGKVAVNHPKGKNLIGAFHPPVAVVADTAVLGSLPQREMLSGMFEALKAGVIGDPELFAIFEERRIDIDEIVRRAIRVKAEIVSADEKESDLRRLLNYGHTIAHRIEAAMHYEGITHGEAVAWGMIAANAIAVRRGVLAEAERARIDAAIRAYQPEPLPRLAREEIVAATEHDKKNTGKTRIMVLPCAIGRCEVVSGIDDGDLRVGIDAIQPGS